jgi:hypothetical protein
MMTDEEYKKFLTALAAKHVRPGAIGDSKDIENLQNSMRNMTRVSRRVQDAREEQFHEKFLEELAHELRQTPLSDGFAAMDRIGVLEALDDATDAVFSNLRRSAIPDEDVQFLYRAGFADPELEITILIEYANRRISSSRESLARELRQIRDIHRVAADRMDRELHEIGKEPEREQQPKKRKILNGIGKILGGAIAGTGNVLLALGTIAAPNPATGAAAIASGGVAVTGVLSGLGDLRGE